MSSENSDNNLLIPSDIMELSFEEALAELEDIVEKLEGGDVSLEDSIEIYTRGSLLKYHCEAKLRAAEERIEKVIISPDGLISLESNDF